MNRKIKNILFTICHPSYWIMNHEYSEVWDTLLRKQAEEQYFTPEEDDDPYLSYTVKLGSLRLWVANHPYASFTQPPFDMIGCRRIRPSRLTIYQLHKKMIQDIANTKPYN